MPHPAGRRVHRVPDPRLREDLARRGLRLTVPRRVILELVRATDQHPTAEWIHAEVRRRLPRVSLGTVYRNLRLLVRHGLLTQLAQDPSVRFDGRTGHHHHFTCQACGRIFDLDEPRDRRIEGQLAARTGFVVLRHRIEFQGLCVACGPAAGTAGRRGSSTRPRRSR